MPSQLERTALSLERKGNNRLLICVVEKWSEVGDPTLAAQLAQIRALLDLCVMDRAWARLKPLLEGSPKVEIYRLAGELLVKRGSTREAVSLLERGIKAYPSNPHLKALHQEATEPRTLFDDTDPLEEDAEGQTRLAARLLVEGKHLKARKVLERLKKKHANHGRANDLLWALEGDFELRGATLQELARVHASPALLDVADASEDHTESTNMAEIRKLLGEDLDGPGSFPSLFKNLDNPPLDPEAPLEDEVTLVSTAGGAALQRLDTSEVTVAPSREDTQIMHIVRKDPQGPEGADTLVDKPFVLNPTDAIDVEGESEDEDVIVRRRVDAPAPANPRDHDRIHLDPERERVQRGANVVDEAAEFMRPRKKRPPPVIEEVSKKASNPPNKPSLSAAPPSKKGARASNAVSLERVPAGERRKIDPSAPTEILEYGAPSRRPDPGRPSNGRIAPWTGWLLVLTILGMSIVAVGLVLVLIALTSS